MNGYIAGGIGAGIAGAAREVQRGVLQAYDIKTRRELQTRQQQREYVLDVQRADAAKQSSDLKDLQIQAMQLQIKQITDDITKKDTHAGFDGYRASGGDVKYLNNSIKNPNIRKLMNGVNGFYKVDPEADMALLNKIGITAEDIADKDFDSTRYVKATRDGGAPGSYDIIDLYGAYAKTGYINTMKKEEIQEIANKAKLSQSRKVEAITAQQELETESAEGWLKANPDKTYQDYMNLKKSTTERRGPTEKLIATYDRENPDATTEERKAYVDKVFESKVYGVAEARETKSAKDLTSNQLAAIDLIDGTEYSTKEALRLENNIMANLDTSKKTLVKDDLKSMKANHKMVVSIDRILREDEEGSFKVDKDAVANVETYLRKIFGEDTPQALKNVDFNTATGALLAGFIKDISGTAASQAEVDRLANIFSAGDLADEVFVKQAMGKFASESREANKILKNNNKHYVPESVHRFTTYGETATKTEKPVDKIEYERTATNPNTGERMGFRNGSWEPIQGVK